MTVLIHCCPAQLSSERFHVATATNRCRNLQPNIRQISGKSYGKGVREIIGDGGDKDSTRKSTESTKLGSQGHTETELTARTPVWDLSMPSECILKL